MKPRIILDTNIFISGILFGGIPRKIIESVLQGQFTLCLSEPLWEELEGVLLRPKFHFSGEVVHTILNELKTMAFLVDPERKLSIIKEDPSDNRLLEAAVTARTDIIVSGDKHLLQLRKFRDTSILSPREFLDAYLKKE